MAAKIRAVPVGARKISLHAAAADFTPLSLPSMSNPAGSVLPEFVCQFSLMSFPGMGLVQLAPLHASI